jgi:hypothetical protein
VASPARAHRVKVKKPSNIKRSRAMVNPLILKKFFHHLTPIIEGVPASQIFNYHETGSSQYFYDTSA